MAPVDFAGGMTGGPVSLVTAPVWICTLVVGYPTALFVGLFVRNKTLQTALLVVCVIPFWTSFLIRVLAWRPMLGKEGGINLVLQALHITTQPIEALLFTELSVIIGMTQIYCVFMVGPIAFMLSRIDPCRCGERDRTHHQRRARYSGALPTHRNAHYFFFAGAAERGYLARRPHERQCGHAVGALNDFRRGPT